MPGQAPPGHIRRGGPPPIDPRRDLYDPDDGQYLDEEDAELDPMTVDVPPIIGAEEARSKVHQWAERVLASPEAEGADGRIVFELRPVGLGKVAPIETFPVDKDEDPAIVSDMIVDRAIEDGGSLEFGKGRYAVTVRDKPSFGRRGFTIDFGAKAMGEEYMDQLPDQRGFTHLAMQHAHESHNFALEAMREVVKHMRQERYEDREELKLLKSGYVETTRTMGEVYRAAHERELALKRLDNQEKRLDQVAGFLMAAAPAIGNKILGDKVLKEPSTPIELQGEGFLRTLTQEQWQAIARGEMKLSPEQTIAFMEYAKLQIERAQARDGGQPPQTQAPPNQEGSAAPSAG